MDRSLATGPVESNPPGARSRRDRTGMVGNVSRGDYPNVACFFISHISLVNSHDLPRCLYISLKYMDINTDIQVKGTLHKGGGMRWRKFPEERNVLNYSRSQGLVCLSELE